MIKSPVKLYLHLHNLWQSFLVILSRIISGEKSIFHKGKSLTMPDFSQNSMQDSAACFKHDRDFS